MSQPLQIERQHYRGQSCLKLSGSLGFCERAQLLRALQARKHLRLDLSEVSEIDLCGLSWLLQAENRVRRLGGEFRIVAASPAVKRAIQLLRPATGTLARH